MLDEVRRDEMFPSGAIGQIVTNIQSSVEVHDGTTIDPGLISLSIDYGYMRAYDVLEGGNRNPELATLSDQITKKRMEIWQTEYAANGIRRTPRPRVRGEILVQVPAPEALTEVRQLKQELFALVEERRAIGGTAALPTGVEHWWQDWERHPWQPFIATPWDVFDSPAGHVDAGAPPT
jgi:hypothetical protein